MATSDGIVVNQHFGRASQFVIIEIDEEERMRVVDRRLVTPVCEGGNHDIKRMEENIEKLADCNYILVSRIGQGANSILEEHQISAFEIPGMIEDSIKKLLAFISFENLLIR